MKKLIALAITLTSISVFAGKKEQFVDAVKKQCPGKNADTLATGGRQGNVFKYFTCTTDSIEFKAGAEACTLICKSASSKIGG